MGGKGYISIETTEAWAIREALAMANRREWTSVRVYSDAKDTVELINQGNCNNAMLSSIRKLIEDGTEKGYKRDVAWKNRKEPEMKRADRKARGVNVEEDEWVKFADKNVCRRMRYE